MPPAAPAPMEAATAGSCRAGGGVRCFCCCCCCDRSAGRLVPEAALLWTGSSNITRSGCSAAAGVFAGCWPGCCPENLSMELGRGGTADMLFVCDPSSLASRLGVAPRSTLQDSPWASDVCTAYAPYADVRCSPHVLVHRLQTSSQGRASSGSGGDTPVAAGHWRSLDLRIVVVEDGLPAAHADVGAPSAGLPPR